MKAIILQGEAGKAALVHDRPYPRSRPGYVLVDVRAVALNPTDWKHIDEANTKGCLVGCDFAGVVAQVGSGYTKDWKVGDRICGFSHGGNELEIEDGAFAERIAVKADIAIRIPDFMSFEDAATLGVGVITCGQGLFQQMGLNTLDQPSTKGEYFLVYGGSTATGTLGIQFTKLAGYTPITICSARNFPLAKSLGAVEAFDYKDADVVEKIKKYTNHKLKYVWDTVSLSESAKICAGVVSPGGVYGNLLDIDFPRDDVKVTFSLGYTAMGERVLKDPYDIKDTTGDFEFMKKWIATVESRLTTVKHHPTRVGKGFENILDGCDLLRKDKVSGEKLVYVV